MRIKKSADLQTRFFNFVKYTKTLSVRNQHDTDSRAFFLRYATRLTFEHTICSFASPGADHCARSIVAESAGRELRRKFRTSKRALFHLGFFESLRFRMNSVCCCLLFREHRCVAITRTRHAVYKFVAIMRQSAANGKHRNRTARAKKRIPQDPFFSVAIWPGI
ncbi:hypothetical protein ACFQT4_01965 [Pseudoduganella danionis]|uniref:hypothetical protein n=1 Tax=Pseudoduganella danionis TaxID=1890295 RepID=UPI00361B3C12